MEATTLQETRSTSTKLENNLEISRSVIDILNSRTNEDMEAMEIRDITKTIMDASKLIAKRNLVQVVQDKETQLERDEIISNPYSSISKVKASYPLGMEMGISIPRSITKL